MLCHEKQVGYVLGGRSTKGVHDGGERGLLDEVEERGSGSEEGGLWSLLRELVCVICVICYSRRV